MKKNKKYNKVSLRLVFSIIPAFLIILIFFFVLSRDKIIEISKHSFLLRSQNYADKISSWSDKILSELGIYKDFCDEFGVDNEKTFQFFESSYNRFESFPYGLYWGDIKGNYFDASGWVPPKGYVSAERNWYKEGLFHEEFSFGEPYVDVMTGNTCVSVSVKVGEGENESVLATDVYLDYATKLMGEITDESVENAFFATPEEQMVIACSDKSIVGKSLKSDTDSQLYKKISALLSGKKTGIHRVSCSNGVFYVNVTVVGNTNWFFVSIMRQEDVFSDLIELELVMLIITLISASILIIIVKKIVKQLTSTNKKAKMDSLTRIFNRDGFKDIIMMAMEAYPNQGLLLIMDLDNFKLINDQMGHPEGDEVLKRFAQILDNYFNRNKDTVARIGGDEFAVFVGRVITEGESLVMLRKFIELFHRTFDEKYQLQKLSISIGGAFNKDNISYSDLYKKADNMLYKVKEGGKDNFLI